VTVSGEPEPVAVNPPGLEVAVYDVIAEPPSLAGAENGTVACLLPAVAVPMVGAPGTVDGVTLFEAPDAAPLPTALRAVTAKVYACPFVRPLTVTGDVAEVPVRPPGLDVAV
jgi:hypothetical protein